MADKIPTEDDGLTQKQRDKKAKQERAKQYQLQQQQQKKENAPKDKPIKTKAELKAERRALQEAQRASKAAGGGQKDKSNPEKQSGGNKKVENQQNVPKSKSAVNKTTSDAPGIQRVAYNVQMDDEKVQKKISKKLAKQQVPQRSMTQKKVYLFAHLHQYERDLSLTKDISFSSGTIHPAIIKLGLQYAEGIITGSNARCISLLCALKQVISDYVTPQSKELSRDLESKIKPCISFLSQCRHMSVSMGNAIKYLKLQITQIPTDMAESEAKAELLDLIDSFIKERILLAGKQICNFAFDKIQDGDKILTYGFSSVILQLLKDAKEKGTNFEVVVVDCRPDFPGKETVKILMKHGIKCTYCLINAVSYALKDIAAFLQLSITKNKNIKLSRTALSTSTEFAIRDVLQEKGTSQDVDVKNQVTTVFIGADALLANGNVMARAGSAMVALVAKSNNVPVLVCCETYKFCERVQTDSFVFNELGDPDSLVDLNQPNQDNVLTNWRETNHLFLLNLIYDVTPSNLVDMVITEIGMIPCTSVPVVLRVKSTER